MKYLYAFGDGWEHTIKVERFFETGSGVAYPVLIEAKGTCPPEDVSGPPGWAEYLEGMADPDHERHEKLVQWRRPDLAPRRSTHRPRNAALVALAKRWNRKPTFKQKPRSVITGRLLFFMVRVPSNGPDPSIRWTNYRRSQQNAKRYNGKPKTVKSTIYCGISGNNPA